MTAFTATGLATIYEDGTVLDAWFPNPTMTDTPESPGTVQLADAPDEFTNLLVFDPDRRTTRVAIRTTIENLDEAPIDAYDAYLRLHLLSHRLVKPHGQNLDGIFGLLANVVWTNFGPCSPENFEMTRQLLSLRGPVTVFSVDKFPRMVDYVMPSGVRIGDANRIRLGAHLAEGTTVMHEGFVNFNAGTLGASMVEGRISAGVVVADGSDIGGGASIMGTLSGGGKQVISIAQRCLLGANAGLGISLGNDCVIEAGLYITAGAKIIVRGDVARALELADGDTIKAVELSGASNILYRRNSLSGAIEAVAHGKNPIELNAALHAN
ncbi:2,3,4,5-tetrahydropyridine-2,6-dicarboxylate N-succinyltransferase [Corynebacterium sp. ES2794-CONJ1]|uniref:2,3,4,5-tetrahydropyridine-2,6-dicarboxylate N-succinyltransferase n=1 Tax=unclassified Corynebacterium TaxID=2624378 RepID=UPI00216A6D10|nr:MULTISPECIES: 2,3,4,5-tetrahydropyridine-2,6-dicarboxylate N-succinyltransferase [unclassified Corynebacterium]MCS4489885.1 2,3,4,5-tetrahydropyridine-2,6-dicarboxylate N-succinyltransferase [Corynebacterium sp. ES2775-CONJ]MCS4491751.1 2,3,4,5-tetrahydropyridine-2,6-dicarboxylate N-succinyltransferase [Corynebacterium sp. ES2715-CONJ3]MCS4531856.1 2,3,4,5-tetrahydropyridine-2,6-dicarboxylate N-succinyltransferase [Corynebacterium sp. ES2730-CONJ]MCU9519253.1 2,3,4,5-tetrahydropyridine-2,6-d